MRALFSALLTVAFLTSIGYVLENTLPSSSTITVNWNAQQYFVPYPTAAFWGCVALGIIVGIIQMIRIMLEDAQRLR
jgi:hypothetical protein